MDYGKKKKMDCTYGFYQLLFCSVTAFAAARDSKGWNVYNSSGTVYANVGVTYVSDTFKHKTVVGYTARVLGEDASAVTQTKPARLEIEGQYSGKVDKYFWDGPPRTGTENLVIIIRLLLHMSQLMIPKELEQERI